MDVLMVGTALDTNGQKRRFVEAARRWGTDPDVLRALIVGKWDGAGIPARYAEASGKLGQLAIRSAHQATAYFDFPYDILWDRRRNHREVQALADEADIIHLTNDVKAYFRLHQARHRKPAVLHHHGTLFRSQHERLRTEARRLHFVQAVSTIDLKRYAPDELHWLPAPLDLDAMRQIRSMAQPPTDVVRIVSAPTRRDLKSTERLVAAVERLKAEGLSVELVLVEGRTWAECLRIKATADIYFDQVAVPEQEYPGGYGCNAIEAWGMGIPVVAGADEWTTNAMLTEFGGSLPFYAATEATITDALRSLVQSKALRTKWTTIGTKHVQKFHAEKPALERLAHLYGLAIQRMATAADGGVEEFALAPGTFLTAKARTLVIVKNQQYRMRADEPLHIASPQLAQAMRRIARFQPQHRISEQVA